MSAQRIPAHGASAVGGAVVLFHQVALTNHGRSAAAGATQRHRIRPAQWAATYSTCPIGGLVTAPTRQDRPRACADASDSVAAKPKKSEREGVQRAERTRLGPPAPGDGACSTGAWRAKSGAASGDKCADLGFIVPAVPGCGPNDATAGSPGKARCECRRIAGAEWRRCRRPVEATTCTARASHGPQMPTQLRWSSLKSMRSPAKHHHKDAGPPRWRTKPAAAPSGFFPG